METGRRRSFEDSIHSERFDGNIRVISYQPGNMTRYTIMITRFDNLKDGPLREIGISGSEYWAVTLLNNPEKAGTVVLRKSDEIRPWQIEALSEFNADRVVLAEFIGWLMLKDR